jgi:hypothetical protein
MCIDDNYTRYLKGLVLLSIIVLVFGLTTSCALVNSMFTAKPSQPILLFPANDSDNISIFPSLSWNSSRADRFYIYIGTSSELTYQNLVAERNDFTYESLRLDLNTTYYWKIEASNDGGTVSSEVFSFKTTGDETLFYPTQPLAPTASITRTASGYQGVFSWYSDLAESYDIYFGTVDIPELYVSGFSENTIMIVDLLPKTVYFWKVIAKNTFGESAGAIWQCETGELPPSVPIAVFPEQNTNDTSLQVNITWTESICPLCSTIGYELWFSEYANFLVTERYSGLTQPTYWKTSLGSLTDYYWKVIAYSEYGSAESEIYRFSTKQVNGTELPESPYAPQPLSGSENIKTDITLSWNGGQTDTYSVYLGLTEGTLTLIEQDITSPVYPITGLQRETLYYWKIIANNASGSSESPIWHFTTEKNDTTAPSVVSMSLSMPYNPDQKVALGGVTKLKAAIKVEDDVKLCSAVVRMYANKAGDSSWHLLGTKNVNLLSFLISAQWNNEFQIDTSTSGFFNSSGYFFIQVTVTVEDQSGNSSAEVASDTYVVQVVKDSGLIPEIEGMWTGSFTISYIIYVSDSLQLNVVKTGENAFSITVSYKDKNYVGTGNIDANGDLRITTRVEGVDVILIGSFDSEDSVAGSVFVLREDQTLTQIGVWNANKT